MIDITLFDTTSEQEILRELCCTLEKRSNLSVYDSDMEMVILELWSLMLDMQNYTMDLMTKQMKQEMRCFLGVGQSQRKSAEGILFASPKEHGWLWKHRLFDEIAKLPFEVKKTTYIQKNKICLWEVIVCEQRNDVDTTIQLEATMEIELTLEEPLVEDHPFSLYVLIANQRVSPSPKFVQGRLCFSYESKHGWCKLAMEDETMGLLKSGIVCFTPRKKHQKSADGKGWKLRFSLCDANYDEFPIIQDIFLNPVMITQSMSYARSYKLPVQTTIELQDTLAIEGSIYVFASCEDGYRRVPFSQEITVHGVLLTLAIEETFAHLRIVLHHASIFQNGILGSTTGESMQRMNIPYQGVEHMCLMMKQEEVWHIVELYPYGTLRPAQPYGAWLNEEEGWIQFGCGKDFLIPIAGNDNVLCCDVLLCQGKKGNIQDHVLTMPCFEQKFPIEGGQDPSEAKFEEAMKKTCRLSPTAIQTMLARFPGNALHHMHCVSMKDYESDEAETGYLVFLGAKQKLTERYMKNVQAWLSQQVPMGLHITLRQAEPLLIHMGLHAHLMELSMAEIRRQITTWVEANAWKQTLQVHELNRYLWKHQCIREMDAIFLWMDAIQLEEIEGRKNCYFVLGEISVIA